MIARSEATSVPDTLHMARPLARVIVAFAGAGISGVVLYCLAGFWSEGVSGVLTRIGIGALTAGASLLTGVLGGFLFGIPKAFQSAAGELPGGAGDSSVSVATRTRLWHGPNTNLEQISDWLTKILVGVGLTQLSKVPNKFWLLAVFVGGGFGGTDADSVLSLAVIVHFLVLGFMAGFLSTKLFLAPVIAGVEQAYASRLDPGTRKALEGIPLEFGPPTTPHLPGSPESRAVIEVSKLKLEDLETIEDMRAWAKAQIVRDKPEESVRAYRRALEKTPNDSVLQEELAVALSLAGQHSRSIGELKELLKSEAAPEGRLRVVEGLMYNYLYERGGYKRTIEYGEEFRRQFGDPKSPKFWAYLACGYGQKHAVLKDGGIQAPILQELRDKALEAVKKAIEIEPAWQMTLRMLWDPRHPGKDPEESDLESFADDPEFQKALIEASSGSLGDRVF